MRFDVLIIGGGSTGCFTARSLSRRQVTVGVLERHSDLCMGMTRANNAIVYSGYNSRGGTLKARLERECNRAFDTLCRELDVEFLRCGSLMTACGPKGEARLRRKLENGRAMGLTALRLLDRAQVLELEPGLRRDLTCALYTPDTGVVNPWELGTAAGENAAANGVSFFLDACVTDIRPDGGGYAVHCGDRSFRARAVINCAGLQGDWISQMAAPPYFRLTPVRGDFVVLDTTANRLTRHVIFQEEEDGKGVVVSPTADGNVLLGPSAEDAAGREDYATTASGVEAVLASARRCFPALPPDAVIRSFGALRLRPDWLGAPESIHDFILRQSAPGFFDVTGVKTPGLTCAPGLGEEAARLALDFLGGAPPNPEFDPVRRRPPRFRLLGPEARAALAARDPAWGNLICRCRMVTEYEIRDAIRRTLGARTLDGVKRRTGAGMGRCQGGYCEARIAAILAQELGLPLAAVRKDDPGSPLVMEALP